MKSTPISVGEELPSTEQLAMLAATLARSTSDDPKALADAAMSLWLAARARLFQALNKCEIEQQDFHLNDNHATNERLYNDMVDGFEKTFLNQEYPMKRDRFLRIMLPNFKSRTADLARIGKAYVRWVLNDRNKKEPTPEEVSGAYGNWKPYEKPETAEMEGRQFDAWYRQHVKDAHRAAGMKSAKKKAAEKRKAARSKKKAAAKRKAAAKKS